MRHRIKICLSLSLFFLFYLLPAYTLAIDISKMEEMPGIDNEKIGIPEAPGKTGKRIFCEETGEYVDCTTEGCPCSDTMNLDYPGYGPNSGD